MKPVWPRQYCCPACRTGGTPETPDPTPDPKPLESPRPVKP